MAQIYPRNSLCSYSASFHESISKFDELPLSEKNLQSECFGCPQKFGPSFYLKISANATVFGHSIYKVDHSSHALAGWFGHHRPAACMSMLHKANTVMQLLTGAAREPLQAGAACTGRLCHAWFSSGCASSFACCSNGELRFHSRCQECFSQLSSEFLKSLSAT